MTVSLGQSCTPKNTRIYAIGDVHGHIALLDTLFTSIEKDLKEHPIDNHKIIFLGDYIDRGPDSSGCVEFLIQLMATNKNVICLKGNHEDKLENFLEDPIKFADSFFTYGGTDCAISYGVDMSTGYRGNDEEALEIAKDLGERMPGNHKAFYADLQTTVTIGDYMFTHAGVRPGIALDQQSTHDLIWIRAEFISNSELYEKVIIHGHTPTFPMEVLQNRINVDTWAYDTGVLSCIVLEGTDYRVIDTGRHKV